ncbi:hypothetical protein [Brochothrix thermosphacta]|uniref:hypothetical protein n=1 Tax=Brochothrix thermosphacta TaxID=2756 RepID=UPI00083FAEE6|nr:hypothetical protein [Brochothrix thermosphacta]ODJ63843.1 hypothetical protein BFR36_11185 [Brochothrix thermosphacta]
MKKLNIYCESHYFDSSKAGYGGYVIEYEGHYKTYTTISVHIVTALIILDMLWQAVGTLKESCDITVVSRQNLTVNDLKTGEGNKLWEFINQLKVDKGHKYTFEKYPNESDIYVLDEILKELGRVKRPKIDFNKILKEDNISREDTIEINRNLKNKTHLKL